MARCFREGLLLLILLATGANGTAQVRPENRGDTSRSESGQYVAVSRDRVLNQNLLELTTDARDHLAENLGLQPDWRHLVRLVPYEADNEQLTQYPVLKAFLDQGNLSFEVHFPTNTPGAFKEFIRTLVYTFLYEAILQDREKFDDGEPLPDIPVWLAEGVMQQLDAENAGDWHRIVNRAVSLNKAPSLSEVMSWSSLSSEPLMRAWQQAFSYQMMDYLMDPARNREFAAWLREQGTNKKDAFTSLRPMIRSEIDWRHVLSLSGEQGTSLIYGFDETASRFSSLVSIRMPGVEGQSEDRVVKLEQLAPYHRNPKLESVINAKLKELLELELRAHFSWRPVIAWYRAALTRLASADRDALKDYETAVAKAERMVRELNRYHENVNDYVNWFLVAKAFNDGETQFKGYYRVRSELESFEPPQHDRLRSSTIRINRR